MAAPDHTNPNDPTYDISLNRNFSDLKKWMVDKDDIPVPDPFPPRNTSPVPEPKFKSFKGK
jgi:hypothetical protein